MNNELMIVQQNQAAKVIAPYHKDFPAKMRELKGVWDKPNQCWWVHTSRVTEVRKIMRDIFGTDDIQGADFVDLNVTFHQQEGAYRKDYTLYGKVLSHATSLTSGGICGTDVIYLEKRPESGGSIKNWCSVVPEGAVIRLYNVPRHLAEETVLPPHITMEYAQGNHIPDPKTLMAEKQDLLARIQEIDLLLAMQTGEKT